MNGNYNSQWQVGFYRRHWLTGGKYCQSRELQQVRYNRYKPMIYQGDLWQLKMSTTKSKSLWFLLQLFTLILLVNGDQASSVPINKTIRMGYLMSSMSRAGAINVAIENAQNDGLLRDYDFRYNFMHLCCILSSCCNIPALAYEMQ